MAGSHRKSSRGDAVVQETADADLGRDLGGAIRTLVFFVLFYLYLWLSVDLRLIYHGGGIIANFPVFVRGGAFFEQFMS